MEKYYIATLHAISQIGHQTIKKLIEIFGSAKNVWRAELPQLQQSGLTSKAVENFSEFRRQYPDAVEKLIKFCEVKKVKICTFYDEYYPLILKEISGSPVVFYYRGKLQPNAERISIVGTREPTTYGKNVARMLSEEFVKAGLTVVSGAAKGIDTIAHEATLKFGRTVAVLGYGINKVPFDKIKLFEKIVENGGAIITDFPPNFQGDRGTFPARNRIIAGLSRSVIIVEAGKKSGALITAGFAADNSREVFVIPHSIFSEKGEGCNNLIREGATLITCAADVLEAEYYADNKKIILRKVLQKAEKVKENEIAAQNISTEKTLPQVELNGVQKLVYDVIPQDESITTDKILEKVNNFDEVDEKNISMILTRLELDEYISETEEGNAYIRKIRV